MACSRVNFTFYLTTPTQELLEYIKTRQYFFFWKNFDMTWLTCIVRYKNRTLWTCSSLYQQKSLCIRKIMLCIKKKKVDISLLSERTNIMVRSYKYIQACCREITWQACSAQRTLALNVMQPVLKFITQLHRYRGLQILYHILSCVVLGHRINVNFT